MIGRLPASWAVAAFAVAAGWLPPGASHGQGGLNRAEAIAPFLNGVMPSQTPISTGAWTLVEAFPGLTFIDPVQMLPVPGQERMLVLEKAGRLVVFNNQRDAATKTVLIDFRDRVESQEDSGALGVAFHPEFGTAGSANRDFLYVHYRFTVQKSEKQRAYVRLSRFTWNAAAAAIDPASEQVLINQYDRHNWHNGGGMFFGPEGFLYLAIGDEGGENDQYNATQRLDGGLFGGVLRIDVDRKGGSVSHPVRRQPLAGAAPPAGWPATYSQGYYIPSDNPWLSPDGSRLEEFWCIGARSPHRMTRDPVTGDIYLGDIGQAAREEVSLVSKAVNLQWPYREGSIAGAKAKPANLIGTDRPPLHDYGRGDGGCVIGGYVYRGREHAAALGGKYIFGDHNSGRIWALTRQPNGTVEREDLVNLQRIGPGPKNGLAGFALDREGELYVLSLYGTDSDGGRILKLARSGSVVAEPPLKLSETGTFADLATLRPAPGLIPYDVNAPLWTDGADKTRWIAIPNDGTPSTTAERIVFSENGHWVFPQGTVIVKQFDLRGKRLETRFLVHGSDGVWYGLTYRWRDDGSDADLLLAGEDAQVTAGGRSQTWTFPSRSQCLQCHNASAGRVIGVNTRQLNGPLTYPATGRTANQLVTLNRLSFFTAPIDEDRVASFLRSAHHADQSASLELRARSYLDSNCAHCHNPGGGVAEFDYRLTTPLSLSGVVNGPIRNAFGVSGAREVAPGDPARSMAHVRQATTDASMAMPPVGRHAVDEAALGVVRDWILSLDAEEYPEPEGHRYVRFVAKSEVNGKAWTSMAEFHVLGADGQKLDRAGWRVVSVDSEEPYGDGLSDNVLDGDAATLWHTQWYRTNPKHAHEIVIDLGQPQVVTGFSYLPRQDGPNGRVRDYDFYLSNTAGDWGTPVSTGRFVNSAAEQGSSVAENHPPVLAAIPAQSGTAGTVASLLLGATDEDGDVLTYAASGLPAGLSLNAATGRISGTPTTAGTSTVSLSVSDPRGATSTGTFVWTIADAPKTPSLPGASGGGSSASSGGGTSSGSGSSGSGGESSGSSGSGTLAPPLFRLAFDEGKGTVARDGSGNGRNATLAGGITWPAGHSGKAIATDGVNDFARIPHQAALNLGANGADFTVAFWHRLGTASRGQWRCLAKKGDTANARAFGLYLFPDSTRVGFSVGTTADWNEAGESQGPLPVGQWAHLALVKRGQRLEFYLDGLLDSVVALEGRTVGNTGAIYLGRGPNDAMPTKAAYDDFIAYDRALSTAEVLTLAGKAGQEPEGSGGALLARLPLDEGSGSTAADASGNGRVGTLLHQASWVPGRSGQGVAVDGSNDALRLANEPDMQLGTGHADFTAAFWYRLQQGPQGQWRGLAKQGDQSSQRGFSLYLHPDTNRVGFATLTSAGHEEAGDSQHELALDEWTHVGCVKRGDRLELYLDGELDSAISLSGRTIGFPAPIYFGATPDDSTSAVGAYDDIVLQGKALSASEMLALASAAGTATPAPLAPSPTPVPADEGWRWRFDEGKGKTAANTSGGSENAGLRGTAGWITGPRQGALRLDGKTGYARIEHTPALNPGANNSDFTVSVWFNLRRTATKQWRALAKKGNNAQQRAFGLYLFPDSNRIGYSIGTNLYFNESGASNRALTVGQWTHIALVRRGAALELWLDGALDASTPLQGTTAGNPGAIFLGYGPGDAVYTQGDFDEFRILPRALEPAEIGHLKDASP